MASGGSQGKILIDQNHSIGRANESYGILAHTIWEVITPDSGDPESGPTGPVPECARISPESCRVESEPFNRRKMCALIEGRHGRNAASRCNVKETEDEILSYC